MTKQAPKSTVPVLGGIWLSSKGRRFINFEFVHPNSAGESNSKTYLEKAIFDILSKFKRGRIFGL